MPRFGSKYLCLATLYTSYWPLCLQVQAVSAEGSGNYSVPASFTMGSFPAAYIGAIVASAISLAITTATIILLVTSYSSVTPSEGVCTVHVIVLHNLE